MVTNARKQVSASDAGNELQRISRELKRIQQQMAQKKSVRRVREFQKNTRDVLYENNVTARDMGQLKPNQTRLNLFSALTGRSDTADVFRFKVTQTSETTIGILNATEQEKDKVRFQIISRSTARAIADSDAKAGELRSNFDALLDGTFKLQKGEYILRVSRSATADAAKDYSYAIQLHQGLYREDYDMIERARRPTDDPFGVVNASDATTSLIAAIGSSVNFVQNLPRIGTPATAKLSGLLIDQLF